MKRLFCLILVLCMLCSAAPAEEYDNGSGDWTHFESRFGFSLWYPEDQLSQWSVEWEGSTAECFCPLEDHSGNAWMLCRGSRFSALLWEDCERLSPDEPAVSLEYPFELTVYTDGDIVSEQWIVSAADGDSVFIIQYEQDDPQGWADLFHAVLETLEFPSQPAVNRDFLLDYFQGGAAGMQFIDVVYDEEAEPITLVPYREMQDFVLEALTWDDEAFTVSEAFPLYAASPLAPGDNLNIYCYFEDILPVLRLRYTDEEGEPQCWYITQSGRDGSLLLLAEDEL